MNGESSEWILLFIFCRKFDKSVVSTVPVISPTFGNRTMKFSPRLLSTAPTKVSQISPILITFQNPRIRLICETTRYISFPFRISVTSSILHYIIALLLQFPFHWWIEGQEKSGKVNMFFSCWNTMCVLLVFIL